MKIRFTISLKGATRHDQQANVFVGFCPALKIYSQGRTESEAKEALESTLCLFVETCYKRGILHQVLRDAGFNAVDPHDSSPTSEACEEYIMIERANFDRVFDMNVPLELVAAAALGGDNAGSGSRTS